MKYLFDLDGTLVDTDELNRDAYRYALEKLGYPKTSGCETRLTRKDLSFVNADDLEKIIKLKQKYFAGIWLPYRITINTALMQRIKKYGKDNCYIWTKASKNRVNSILKQCNLTSMFKSVLYDQKFNWHISMKTIQRAIGSDEFIIFDNEPVFFDELFSQNIAHIVSKQFDVYAYHIKL